MWYVVNGEIRGQSTEAVMVCEAESYDDAIDKLVYHVGQDRSLYCMNCDRLTRETAANYRVDFIKKYNLTFRHPDLLI